MYERKMFMPVVLLLAAALATGCCIGIYAGKSLPDAPGGKRKYVYLGIGLCLAVLTALLATHTF